MKLYYDPISTASRPVMLFVAEEGIEVEHEVMSLMAQDNASADYTELNPNQIVPFLVDEDFSMGEASAILKYLAEKTGSQAYPKDLRARAKVNEWMDWFNTQFSKTYCYMTIYPQVLPPDHLPPRAGDMVAYGAQASQRWLNVLDAQLKGKAFVCGDQITLADYLGSGLVSLGDLVGFDLTPWPNVARWMAAMKGRPAWAMVNAGFAGWQAAIQSQAA